MRNARIDRQVHPAIHPLVSQEAKNTMTTRFRQFSRVVTGLVLLCMAGTASAQWEVVDKGLIKTQSVGKGDGEESSGKEVEKPKEALKKVADDFGVAGCASSTSGTPVSDVQKQVCELTQRTRNAQFNYMVAMNEITIERLKRLRKIEKNRTEIKDEQIGLLESNTNKLLALKAMMEIDRQQMESAMFAYDRRLAYLTDKQTGAALAAMSGKDPPKAEDDSSWFSWIPADLLSLGKTLAAGAVMGRALEAIKTDAPSDMRKLKIDKD